LKDFFSPAVLWSRPIVTLSDFIGNFWTRPRRSRLEAAIGSMRVQRLGRQSVLSKSICTVLETGRRQMSRDRQFFGRPGPSHGQTAMAGAGLYVLLEPFRWHFFQFT
jgi:hypothetical protein